MALGQRVAQAHAGVEEVVLLIDVDGLHLHRLPIKIVVHTPRLIIDVAILQIGKERQPLRSLPHSLCKEVCILLIDIVVVPATSNLRLTEAINPIQLAPVRAGVVEIRATQKERKTR